LQQWGSRLVPSDVLLDIAGAGGVGLLWTALLLGFRHGFDWDHIAAISDVTSTTATADAAETVHTRSHDEGAPAHLHGHGGRDEVSVHAAIGHPHAHVGSPGRGLAGEVAGGDTSEAGQAGGHVAVGAVRPRLGQEERRALALGTLYAVGHALVVAALGTVALLFGAVMPDWIDPIMGRVVGLTLVLLGAWVFVSLYQYARHGVAFRLRSRWMLVFDGLRYGWRRFQARLHGHEHADPIEMSSYGPRTALAVGMIHGVGAETGTQVLLIAAIGGASSRGLGLPMMLAFIAGLLVANSLIVVITATGFIASRTRERAYIAIGVVAGTFSLVIGLLFLFQLEGLLPAIDGWLESIGIR
jgi:high-affinity nickel-transport protein